MRNIGNVRCHPNMIIEFSLGLTRVGYLSWSVPFRGQFIRGGKSWRYLGEIFPSRNVRLTCLP